MEPITRETFNRWTQSNKWLQTAEIATTNGRQYTFITPSGKVKIIIFDLKGNLLAIGEPIITPQAGFDLPKAR